jgi:hypothetical protein
MSKEVNQLVLDCVAKVLRINETTKAEVVLNIDGSDLECYGYKCGYRDTPKVGAYPKPDFTPFAVGDFYLMPVYLTEKETEKDLRTLLEYLNALEKELIESGSTKATEEAKNDDE